MQLINSFNGMSQRLFLSLKQNYEIQIAEQQMRVQMLQFQINHHFLHNTLNVIKSLAEIHDVPEIETIATCMSELVRYILGKISCCNSSGRTPAGSALYDYTEYTIFPGKILL